MTTKKLARPHTIADACDILDLSPRRTRHLAQHGLLGKTRLPTVAEQQRFGLPANTTVIRDMGVVQRLAKARAKAATLATVKQARKARKRGRR